MPLLATAAAAAAADAAAADAVVASYPRKTVQENLTHPTILYQHV
jgi:hypothetical protein